MGRQLIVNRKEVDIAVDATAGQLKEELQHERNHWVVIARADDPNKLQHLGDHEVVPAEVKEVSIMPQFQYGR